MTDGCVAMRAVHQREAVEMILRQTGYIAYLGRKALHPQPTENPA
jgi:hypothetical protein